ncbi:MAG: anti-sigma factor, partial [Nocardioidaceae bacterium]|nr:anti-sigma factor [Nocardioidaceae bacterium]
APEGKVYELWLQSPAGVLDSAGLMPDHRHATVLLKGDASRATGVGITVEPNGGSERPTSEPIAFFTLDS